MDSSPALLAKIYSCINPASFQKATGHSMRIGMLNFPLGLMKMMVSPRQKMSQHLVVGHVWDPRDLDVAVVEEIPKTTEKSQRPPRTRTKKEPQPIWHDHLTEDVKQVLQNKHIPTSTGTIDISYQCHPHNDRIKLGTRGYASLADSDSYLAEGKFEADPDGNITLEWERVLHCAHDGNWNVCTDLSNFVTELSLIGSDVGPVGLEETMATLMGNHVTDPKSTLEANDFLMRRVVLTTKKRESRSS